MKTFRTLGLAALAGMLSCAGIPGAMAEEWTGAFIGAHLGSGTTVYRLADPAGIASLKGLGANGILGGIHVGYDFQLRNIVTGLQVEAEKDERDFTLKAGDVGGKLKRKWGVGLSLRGGILPSEHTLVYARAGFGHSRFAGSAYTARGSYGRRKGLNGRYLGAGMEARVAPAVSLRLEYRHVRYDDKSVNTPLGPVKLRPTDHSMRVGVSWRFDDSETAGSTRPATGWTGMYAGLQLADAAHDTELGYAGASMDGLGGNGQLAALFGGYDFQFGSRTLVGAEVGASWSNVKSKGRLGSATASARLRYATQASARIGWLAQPETLLYLRAGWMRGHFRARAAGYGLHLDSDGFLSGLGMETRLSRSLNLRIEYDHVQFPTEQVRGVGIRPALDSGSVGLTMRF